MKNTYFRAALNSSLVVLLLFNVINANMLSKSILDKGVQYMQLLINMDPEITPPIAGGIVGNLMQESSLNHEAQNSLGYTGLAQWDPKTRWPAYKRWLSKNELNDSVESQLRYILEEPSKYSLNTVSLMKDSEDSLSIDKMTALFERKFERSGESKDSPFFQNRIKYGREFLLAYVKKKGKISVDAPSSISALDLGPGSVILDESHELRNVYLDDIKVNGKSLITDDSSDGNTKPSKVEVKFKSDKDSTYFRRRL